MDIPSKSFINKHQIDGIYIDFSKAFHCVDHVILLKKMSYLGIHENLHRWFSSYSLRNKSQLIALYGCSSTSFPVPPDVPQGSHLGPLLFLAFVNDQVHFISCQCLAYAADIIYIACCYKYYPLASVTKWLKCNKLVVHREHMALTIGKCQNMQHQWGCTSTCGCCM